MALGQVRRLGGDREPRARVGQRRRVVAEAGVAAEVADAERQPERALGRGDLGDALQAARGLHQRHDRHVRQPLGGLGDVVDRLDHRQHHPADRRAGQHLEVVGPPLGAEPVDADPVAVARRPASGSRCRARSPCPWGPPRPRCRARRCRPGNAAAGGEPVVLRAVDQQPTAGEYRIDPRSARRRSRIRWCFWSYTRSWSLIGSGLSKTVDRSAQVRAEEGLHRAPSARRGRRFVVGPVVRHGEPVHGRVELDGVLDTGRGQRLVQRLGRPRW